MYDSSPTDEHQSVAEMCKSLGSTVLAPAARQAESDRSVPPGVWKTLIETGLTAPVAEELGGDGIPDTVTQMIAVENLAYGDAGITLAAVWNGAVAQVLGEHAGEHHRELLSTLLTDPDTRVGLAFYEGFGRGTDELATTVSTEADVVHVRGRKVGVPFVTTATAFLVVGRDADGSTRLVTVPADAPGLTASGGQGALALDAADTGVLELDVTVPAVNLVGTGATASPALSRTLQRLRLLVAAVQLGAAERAVHHASEYAVGREAFGRPIAGFQGVAFPLAEAEMRLAQLRLEIAEVASRLDGDVIEDLSAATTEVVNSAGEVASSATRTAVQTLGGHGFIKDHPVEIWYRSCAALSTIDFDPAASAFHAAL